MPDAENKLTSDRSTTETALLVRREADDPTADEQAVIEPAGELDVRFEHLRMQLDVMVKVRSLRVGDLLALARDTVLETIHEHSQDLPVRCGGALLMWAEFEVVEQKLAVRVTRLA